MVADTKDLLVPNVVEEVSTEVEPFYTIDRIDKHCADGRKHDVGMDTYCDRYFCRTCDVWIEPPCDCGKKEGKEECVHFPDQPEKPSLSKIKYQEMTSEKTLASMRRRRRRVDHRDKCEKCHGEKGGTPGNENIVNGRVLCDYCTAEEM